MPRSGAGVYTPTASIPVVSGTTISSTAFNNVIDDLGDEITASLPVSGVVPMTGVLRVTLGSVSAPGLAFSGDTDTGIYSTGANTLSIATAGTVAATFSATQAVTFSGAVTFNSTVSGSAASDYRSNVADKIITTSTAWNAAAEVSVSYSATVTLDLSTGFNFAIDALTGNVTLANPSNPKVGQSGYIRFVQDGTGGRTITYGSNWKKAAGPSSALSTGSLKVDYLFYTVRSATEIICSLQKDVS